MILAESEKWPLRNTNFSAQFDSLTSKVEVWVQLDYFSLVLQRNYVSH